MFIFKCMYLLNMYSKINVEFLVCFICNKGFFLKIQLVNIWIFYFFYFVSIIYEIVVVDMREKILYKNNYQKFFLLFKYFLFLIGGGIVEYRKSDYYYRCGQEEGLVGER